MKTIDSISRRDFLTRITVASSAMGAFGSLQSIAAEPGRKRFKIAGFTKPFQKLSFEETASVAAEVGWDGVECPVRKGGQVEPERVEEDLPKLVEALKKQNIEVLTIATDIQDPRTPMTEKLLRTASKLGIRIYRLAHLHYARGSSITAQLPRIRAGFEELAALNKELGLCAAYENHSGEDSVGAGVWDIHQLLDGTSRDHYGICFDIGHAIVEGGYAWPTNFRLIEPLLKAVYVKDFAWKKTDRGWTADWCSLGQGMVPKRFFDLLKATSFSGPIVQHHEYPIGTGKAMIDAMRKDLQVLKAWL